MKNCDEASVTLSGASVETSVRLELDDALLRSLTALLTDDALLMVPNRTSKGDGVCCQRCRCRSVLPGSMGLMY